MPAHHVPESALIALGSNLGERKATIDFAVERLRLLPSTRVNRVSTYHETQPIGGPDGQGAFLNAAALLTTHLPPQELFDELQKIEAQAGRVRVVRWGERTLDLDLILYGREIVESPTLVVPHPRMAHRSFVLEPAAEIAATMVDPWTGRSIFGLLTNLQRRPSYLAVVAPIGPGRDLLLKHLVAGLRATPMIGLRADGDSLLHAAPPSSAAPEFHEQFRRSVAELQRSQWAESDTWVVSDFWIDQFYVSAQLQFASNTCKLLPFRDAFVSTRTNLLPPTIVAFWDPPETSWPAHFSDLPTDQGGSEWHVRGLKSLDEAWRRLRRAYYEYRETALCRDPMLIVLDPDPTGAASEILAACRATRPD